MSITEWAAYGQNTLLISSFDCVMTSEKVINALARYGPIANLRLVPGKVRLFKVLSENGN